MLESPIHTQDRPIAVLFDLDGTLIDSIGLLLGSLHYAFEGFDGTIPTDEEWVAGIGTPLGTQLAPFARSPEELDHLMSRYRRFQRANHDSLTTLYPGALDTIKALHDAGHPMAIVTSKGNVMMDITLAFTGLAPYMQSTIGCDSCDLHKPDPFPVNMALSELGYSASEAIFVGDSPHDIKAGNGAGVTTVAALWGPFTKLSLAPTHPTHYLEDISELIPLVEAISTTKR